MLIICEGQTEANYFKQTFKVEAKGIGKTRMELVKYANGVVAAQRNKKYEQIWCVFDRDKVTQRGEEDKHDFNKAIREAYDCDFKVAYSIECIELWFALHYQDFRNILKIQDLENGVNYPREDYYSFLKKEWGCKDKKEWTSKDFIFPKTLEDNLNETIERAKEIHTWFKVNYPNDYYQHNPCTNVYELVSVIIGKN